MELQNEIPLNDGQIMVQRDEKGRIRPGSVLNPNGKPKGTKHLSTLLAESLLAVSSEESATDQEVIINKVIEMAKKGDMRAIALVWDRIEGRATQFINQTSEISVTEAIENERIANKAIQGFLEKSYGPKPTEETFPT